MTDKQYNLCVDNFSDNILRFLVKNLKDRQEAEDILQDVFLKLWEKHKEVDNDKVKAYLFKAAYNTMINTINHNKLIDNIEIKDTVTINAQNAHSDIRDILSDALNLLSSLQKASLLLRDYEGYSYNEIGQILNITEENVKINIFRARQKMKKYIGSIDNII
ncbi:MAG: RNA polymerase sigma factor [Bacteroidales bacterium]|jgi:RNA polymerase sigma-70 factor (ECF subfamily)|nr:RNA polymerase sigma factor [Bacteroidales bacterium]